MTKFDEGQEVEVYWFAIGGNDEDMRGARRRLEHGKASIETVGYIDLCTRKRDADAAEMPLVAFLLAASR